MAQNDPFGLLASGLPPEIAAQARGISRQQAIAEALLKQSQESTPGQMVGDRYVSASPLQGIAKVAQAFLANKKLEDTDKKYADLGTKYQTGVADAMMNYQRQKMGTPDTQAPFDMASVGQDMPEDRISVDGEPQGPAFPSIPGLSTVTPGAKADPRKAIYDAMVNPYLRNNPIITSDLAQLNKPPEKLDLGDKWKITYPDGRVVFEPKAATPDAAMRRDTTLATHATPSGSAVLSNQGAMQRHVTPSGNTILSEQGSDRRHAAPSGSAILGSNTTLSTHATPSGSARLAAETARLGQQQAVDPVVQGNLARAREEGKTVGESTAQAAITLPQAAAKAEQAIALVDQMVGSADKKVPRHPGFSGVVGAGTPGMRFIDGTKEASFSALLDQVKGGAFLQAFESLKGGGAITEIEGKKASDAITRMSKSQSESEFVQAAREFQTAIRSGVERTRQRAGTPTTSPRVVDW